jgi:Domain of unknown function (DUF3883)
MGWKVSDAVPILGRSSHSRRQSMRGTDWSRREVETIIDDYLSMLASELTGAPYKKSAHRRALLPLLNGRSEQSIEFKHANISAALLDLGIRPIPGYKPRSNYQSLLAEVLAEKINTSDQLQEAAAADADRPMSVPEVDDILSILQDPPQIANMTNKVSEPPSPSVRLPTNYIEREAKNRSLGAAGELFVINYERARLIHAGKERLAARIEHTSKVRGDQEGYDVLSYSETGSERLIEVKTTKGGSQTQFFVTRNEVATSEREAHSYHVYRLFDFQRAPKLYTLAGPISLSCQLSPTTYRASPR